MVKQILYLTYDGLTDPLGKSQILPYLLKLSENGCFIHILSFEKPERFAKKSNEIKEIISETSIKWHPERFTSSPPILSKFIDLKRFKNSARKIAIKYNIQLIHARSYVSCQVAYFLKRKFNIPYIFDMRGFWVDERMDKFIWNRKNIAYKILYSYYKAREIDFLKEADIVLTLTEQAKNYIQEAYGIASGKIKLVQCATEYRKFTFASEGEKQQAKEFFQIPATSICLGYLGSLGGWYDLDAMLKFFQKLLHINSDSFFLILTPDTELAHQKVKLFNIPVDTFKIAFVEKENLDFALNAFDLSILILQDCFSQIACSPTRLGELWSKGIPTILSEGIGDLQTNIPLQEENFCITSNQIKNLNFTLENLTCFIEIDKNILRKRAKEHFNMDKAMEVYNQTYSTLFTND